MHHAVYHVGAETQNQIKRTLAKSEAIAQIHSVLDGDDRMNRTQLPDQLCEHYGFFDARGTPQTSSCLKALRELERGGHIVLPKPSCNRAVGARDVLGSRFWRHRGFTRKSWMCADWTDNQPHCNLPIEEKESFCWIPGLRDRMEAAKEIPHTRLILETRCAW